MANEDSTRLVERITFEPAVAPSHGKVVLGSFFSVGYMKAYAAAWQRLLPFANELAIPILYLQRHTLELAVKDILGCLLATREELRLCRDVFGPQNADGLNDLPDWERDWKLLHRCHSFKSLFDCLEGNLSRLGLSPLPDAFHKARALFHAVEDGDETRLRYSTVKERATGRMKRSFEDELWGTPTVAPIGELSNALMQVVSVHCHMAEHGSESLSFLDNIIDESRWAAASIADKLQELDTATRSGQIVWNATEEPRLDVDGHPDFVDPLLRQALSPRYLFAEFSGRRFVVLTLRDCVETSGAAAREDDYVLACQRQDGLSRLVSPDIYNSNIIRSALRSWQRLPNDLPL